MTWLPDGNVLVALAIDTHEFHGRASRWFARERGDFTTCAVTQGALLRLHMTLAQDRSAEAAWASLAGFAAHARHEFWPEGFGYTEFKPTPITGAKQVADAWLAELARRKGGGLATFYAALARWLPKIVAVVPVV
ncbi:MAG: VapC toxin family PIN domain ribonuclease [Undibacterium sp.]|nr:VapC toxin family PIN domain ribonuclease [Opitutaceae bacterium]